MNRVIDPEEQEMGQQSTILPTAGDLCQDTHPWNRIDLLLHLGSGKNSFMVSMTLPSFGETQEVSGINQCSHHGS